MIHIHKSLLITSSLLLSSNLLAFGFGDIGDALNKAGSAVNTTQSTQKASSSKTTHKETQKVVSQKSTNEGDIKKEYERIRSLFNKEEFDPRLLRNYITGDPNSPEEVTEWAESIKSYQDSLPGIKAFLDKTWKTTTLGNSREFRRYLQWFNNSVEDDIREAVFDKKSNQWKSDLLSGVIENGWKEEYLKRSLKSQSTVREIMGRYNRGATVLENQKIFEKIVDGKYSKSTQKYIKEYKELGKKLTQAKKDNIKNQRLPEPGAFNAKTVKLAKELLKKSGVKFSHLTLMQDITHYMKVEHVDNAFYVQKMDKFYVKFVAQKNGKHYIVDASFKKVIQWHPNPQRAFNKWYLYNVEQIERGDQILKKFVR